MLLKGTHLTANRGGRQLFTIETLEIQAHDRIGLVGINGCGKSTLLHGLYGDVPFESGQVLRRAPIAMITQDAAAKGVPSAQWAKRLGVKEAAHSGGERTRQAIAAALSQNAPLLLADEPTTNLDISATLLVEQLFVRYDGALVLVSHDRRLLDTVCTTIWALENETLRVYPGNYSAYLAQAERERQTARSEYQAYQAEAKRLTEAARQIQIQARKMTNTSRLVAKGHNTAEIRAARPFYEAAASRKAKQAKAVFRRMEQLEVKEKPKALPEIMMTLGAAHPITTRKALSVKNLTVAYGEKTVLQDVSFTLPTGSRTAIMGPNGAGKSTLLKTLLSPHPAVSAANGLKIGYFAQHHEQLDDQRTVLENARAHSTLPEHTVRTILARLGLAASELAKTIPQLSGGQQAKVAFAQLLASDCNLLILDEPTNHLDSFATEGLEKLLLNWSGTLLVVTHDRQLADKICNRLLLVQNGGVTTFNGNWSAYIAAQSQPNGQQTALAESVLAMRMAEIAGKMALDRQKGRTADPELEEAWQKLLADQRALRKETTSHATARNFD